MGNVHFSESVLLGLSRVPSVGWESEGMGRGEDDDDDEAQLGRWVRNDVCGVFFGNG